jgi:hypothetical protein
VINSRSGWSVVRSASLAKGGTSKKRPSPHLHKVSNRSNKVSPRTLQTDECHPTKRCPTWKLCCRPSLWLDPAHPHVAVSSFCAVCVNLLKRPRTANTSRTPHTPLQSTRDNSKHILCPANAVTKGLSIPEVSLLILYFIRDLLACESRDSSVGIALGYGLDDRGSMVRFPAGAGNFSFHHRVQNGSGAHPASYPKGSRDSFPGGKAPGA